MKYLQTLVLINLLVVFTSSAQAALYKWVDDENQTHYTQHPPQDHQYQVIESKKYKKPTSFSSKQNFQNNPMLNGTNSDENSDNNTHQAAPPYHEKNCKIAQKNLEILKTHHRVLAGDPNDKDRHLTDEEKKKKIVEVKESIKRFCTK